MTFDAFMKNYEVVLHRTTYQSKDGKKCIGSESGDAWLQAYQINIGEVK